MVADVAPDQGVFGPERDALWPKSVLTWLILSVIFLGLSVQFVSPTRRWRPHRPRLRRGPPVVDGRGHMSRRVLGRSAWWRIGRGSAAGTRAGGPPPVIPPDPKLVLQGPLDPALGALRSSLAPHRRRLWTRRIVRRTWIALAVVATAEAALWTVARFIPLEAAPIVGVSIPIVVALVLLLAAAQARPSLGETALAVDAEGHLGDRVSSALELAVGFPGSSGPPSDADPATDEVLDDDAETDRFVRRQRRDALAVLRTAPALFRPRWSRSPAVAIVIAVALLVPVLAIPNPQDAVIAQAQDVREAADRQADRLEDLADELDGKGEDVDDPRKQLAEELRELALRLREQPGELAANLRELGSVENDVRARIDPATEQRASAMTSLARSLSRAATGNPDANRDGDPETTREDLDKLAEELDAMTPEEQRELGRQLAEMGSTASGADGAAATALRDAAQSLAQGDVAGARSALDRLGESMTGAQARTETNRDLAEAASRLQDARRDLADAGRQGQAQQGQGQQGQGQAQGSPQPGASGQGQGQGQGSPQPSGSGQGQGQGQGRARAKGKARVRGKARGRVRARGKVRARAKGKARVRVRGRSVVVAPTPASWARARAATPGRERRPAPIARATSGRTSHRSSPPSTESAGRAIRRTWPGPAATARPSRAAGPAPARTTAS